MYSLSAEMPSKIEPGEGVLLKLVVATAMPSDCKASRLFLAKAFDGERELNLWLAYDVERANTSPSHGVVWQLGVGTARYIMLR